MIIVEQERYSWHKTVLFHHSNKEWSTGDRHASVSSWRYNFMLACLFTLIEWLQMLSLAYPEQSKSPYKYTKFYPIDMIDSYLHFFKTLFFDNESVCDPCVVVAVRRCCCVLRARQ
jgi:hypothetical protein